MLGRMSSERNSLLLSMCAIMFKITFYEAFEQGAINFQMLCASLVPFNHLNMFLLTNFVDEITSALRRHMPKLGQ